ncbi:MAG: hypothetical protein R6V56_09430 [Lentisphaeria bacterium]
MVQGKVNFLGVAAGLLVSAAVIAATGCGKKKADVDAGIAVIPDADLVVMTDMAAMREAPIYKRLEAFGEEQEKLNASNPQADKMKKLGEELKNITGLKDEDFQIFVLSAALEGLDPDAKGYAEIADKLNGVMAVGIAKPVTLDQLEEAAKKATEENEEVEVETSRRDYKGNQILVLTNSKEDKKAPIAVATAADGKVIVIGSMLGAKGALDRAESGDINAASQALGLGKDQQPQMAVRFDLTEAMQKEMQQQKPQTQPGNPMAGAAAAFKGLEQVKAYVTMGKNMDVLLAMAVGSEDDAKAAKNVLDNQVIGMIRMGMSMLAGGQPMPLLESLKTATDPTGTVKFSFSFSPSDIGLIQKAMKKQQTPPTSAEGDMPEGIMPQSQ